MTAIGRNKLRRWAETALLAAMFGVGAAPSSAKAAPVLTPVANVASPVYVTHAADQRLFIVEQAGQIYIHEPDAGLLATPFLNIQSKVSSGGERGLLSIAFHPEYASNGFFYVNYTDLQGHTVIERYRVSADPNLADASSGATLLVIEQPFSNHNGGQLQIGPRDGYLYIGMGDGGSGGDPQCNGQRMATLLGKLLRLDVRVDQNVAPYYAIPADNPFVGTRDPLDAVPDPIWASGLRNPWRFSFDRATGDLYIADVGQYLYEEIDLVRADSGGGQNFGWNAMEGSHCFEGGGCGSSCNAPELTPPIHEYGRDIGCSITGGYVYRGEKLPELRGHYIFGDYCTGAIRSLQEAPLGTWQSAALLQTSPELLSFGEGFDGELYVAVRGGVFRIDAEAAAVPALGQRRLAWLWCSAPALALSWGLRKRSRRPPPRLASARVRDTPRPGAGASPTRSPGTRPRAAKAGTAS